MKDLQKKLEHALSLIARATKENPVKAMRAVEHYNNLMALKQAKLQKMINGTERYRHTCQTSQTTKAHQNLI